MRRTVKVLVPIMRRKTELTSMLTRPARCHMTSKIVQTSNTELIPYGIDVYAPCRMTPNIEARGQTKPFQVKLIQTTKVAHPTPSRRPDPYCGTGTTGTLSHIRRREHRQRLGAPARVSLLSAYDARPPGLVTPTQLSDGKPRLPPAPDGVPYERHRGQALLH